MIMSIKQRKIKIEPRIKLNHNMYNMYFSNLLSREDSQNNLSDTQLYSAVINLHNLFK